MTSMTRHFHIPVWNYQSTAGARRAYAARYDRDWPHDDATLRALARAVPEDPADCAFGARGEHLLNAMRECHVFEEDGQ
jgi:hypothetical protein